MPRPISWLPRLHEIARSVENSVRSHYDRRDLEILFELQPRAAQKLLEILPTIQVGTSRLIDREALKGFLERVRETEDTTNLFEIVRNEKIQASRQKVRSLLRRDAEPVLVDALPSSLELTPGRLVVSFRTIEELAQNMYLLARAIESDGEELARRLEIREPARETIPERADFDGMMVELSELEAEKAD
jgi:hypothetical protein